MPVLQRLALSGNRKVFVGSAACIMNCSVPLYVHTTIQARIGLYRKAGIKLFLLVSVGNMHTEGYSSVTVLVMTWEQHARGSTI